ncbi:MAG TPA: hypothetical protein VKB12_16390 [Pyrinomonadaceae bacterium]|nr:hypothetical protein [Pyrinomonadaceae bacterium]
MEEQRHLPWEVFRLASALLPHLDRIFEQTRLSPTDLFVLSHLKHFGRQHEGEQRIILKNEMLDMLKRVYGYSAPGATRIVSKLHEEGLIEIEPLTEVQKEKYFGERTGYKHALILQPHGLGELNSFNEKLNRLFEQLTADMSGRRFTILSGALAFFSRHAYERLPLMALSNL